MAKKILNKISEKLEEENLYITEYIYEKSVLNFTLDFNRNKSDEDLFQYILKIFENLDLYYLDKEMSDDCKNYLSQVKEIRKKYDNYITPLKKTINDLIDRVKIQKKENNVIQIKNKRRLNRFEIDIKEFLTNNFCYYGQKYYIREIISNHLKKICYAFNDILKTYIEDLIIKNKEISIASINCFREKYNQFQDKLSSFQLIIFLIIINEYILYYFFLFQK